MASQLVPLRATVGGWGQGVGSAGDHQVLADAAYKKQPLAVAEAGRDSVGCTHTPRSNQPVVSQHQAREYCDKRLKHPMTPMVHN